MIKPDRRASEFQATIPATLDAVEQLIGSLRGRALSEHGSGCAFAAELLLREALTNAVVHGCREDANLQVSCRVRCRPGRLTIAVRDDGAGFDWRQRSQRRAADDDCSGRGMEILYAYASRVRFCAAGNAVVLVKQWSEEQ